MSERKELAKVEVYEENGWVHIHIAAKADEIEKLLSESTTAAARAKFHKTIKHLSPGPGKLEKG